MATGRDFSVFASHSVRQPINPKTGRTFTTLERTVRAEKANGGKKRNSERRTNDNAPVPSSNGPGA